MYVSLGYHIIAHTNPFSIQFLQQTADLLGLASCSLSNMVGVAYSVSLTLFIMKSVKLTEYAMQFMSYPIDCAKHGEITNIHSSKCFLQSLLWQVGFYCTMFKFHSQSHKWVLRFWYECILHPLADPFAQL